MPLVLNNAAGAAEIARPGTAGPLQDAVYANQYVWGKRDCRAPQGATYSAWAVGGGTQGAQLPCGSKYPHNVDSWMFTQEYDLSGATDAILQFDLWQNVEAAYDTDTVCRLASIDNLDFYGTCSYGAVADWTNVTLDLKNVPTLGDIRDAPQIWFAIVFHSNGTVNQDEGAYVDNVLLKKCTAVGGCTVLRRMPL